MREDLENRQLAIDNGWELRFNPEDVRQGRTTEDNIPHWSIGFAKDDVVIWYAVAWFGEERDMAWMRARIINNRTQDHEKFLHGNLSKLLTGAL